MASILTIDYNKCKEASERLQKRFDETNEKLKSLENTFNKQKNTFKDAEREVKDMENLIKKMNNLESI